MHKQLITVTVLICLGLCQNSLAKIIIGMPDRFALGEDASPAIKVINATISAAISFQFDQDVAFKSFSSLSEFQKSLETEQVHLGCFWTELEYLQLQKALSLEALVTTHFDLTQGPHIKKTVIVRKDSGLTNIKSLKGKRLAYHKRVHGQKWNAPLNRSDIHLLALALYVTESGEKWRGFFSPDSIEIAENLNSHEISAAILSVLHGQSDLTVVNDVDFLNTTNHVPLAAQELTALTVAKPVISTLPPCFCKTGFDQNKKNAIITAMTKLHQSFVGKKMLQLIPVDRFIPIGNKDYTFAKDFETRLMKTGLLK